MARPCLDWDCKRPCGKQNQWVTQTKRRPREHTGTPAAQWTIISGECVYLRHENHEIPQTKEETSPGKIPGMKIIDMHSQLREGTYPADAQAEWRFTPAPVLKSGQESAL